MDSEPRSCGAALAEREAADDDGGVIARQVLLTLGADVGHHGAKWSKQPPRG